MAEYSGIGVKKLYYGPCLSAVTTAYTGAAGTELSPAELKAFLAAGTTEEILNIHGDLWNYEKTKPTKTYYKNKLSGKNYRGSTTDTGMSKITFSVGKYDFATKAALEGGAADTTKYSASASVPDVKWTLVGLTEDGVYVVFPKADVVAGSVTTDDAIAISVEATALEPDIALEIEAWISKASVDAAT